MLSIQKHGIILEKTSLGFENLGVMNPAVIESGGKIHLYYRAVRQGNNSTIGYARLSDPITVEFRLDVPLLFPQFDYESQGLEDPRICKIEGLFYLTYTAYDGVSAMGALALSPDLLNFKKRGIMVPIISFEAFRILAESRSKINEKYVRYNNPFTQSRSANEKAILWDKNVVFFPRKIQGKFYFMHRIRPDIQLVCVEELGELTEDFWQKYFLHLNDWIMMTAKYPHEASYIGGGCPPIETKEGWLLIYHGVHDTIHGYVYSACAALFDLENPLIEIGRLKVPLFSPEEAYEKTGFVNNVCFPTGAIIKNDTLYIYYGAADERVACASLSIRSLLDELKTA